MQPDGFQLRIQRIRWRLEVSHVLRQYTDMLSNILLFCQEFREMIWDVLLSCREIIMIHDIFYQHFSTMFPHLAEGAYCGIFVISCCRLTCCFAYGVQWWTQHCIGLSSNAGLIRFGQLTIEFRLGFLWTWGVYTPEMVILPERNGDTPVLLSPMLGLECNWIHWTGAIQPIFKRKMINCLFM